MPDDPLQYLVESAKKAIPCGLFSNLLLGRGRQVVNSLFGDSSKLVYREGNHHSAAMDTIDISSSSDDSELREIDAYDPMNDTATSSNYRVLPPWSLTTSSNAGASSGSSRMPRFGRSSNGNERSLIVPRVPARQQILASSSSNGGPSSNGNGRSLIVPRVPARQQTLASSSSNGGPSSNGNGRSLIVPRVPARHQILASSSSSGGPPHSFAGGTDRPVYLIEDDDIDNEQHASKRAKLALPSSLQPVLHSNRSNNVVENMGGSQFRDRRGNYYQTTRGFSTTNGDGYRKDQFGIPSDIMHENKGNRVLPQSIVSGRSANSNAYGNASEPSQNWGMGEERSETDERLVFQAALQDINQPNTEANLPEGLLSVPLLRHQKIALAWMIKKETEGRNCLGGILADDQGLGKTISMIAIILMHRSLQDESKSENLRSSKAEAFNLDEDDDDKNVSDALALVKQKQKVELDDIKVVSEERSSLPLQKPAAGTLDVCPASDALALNKQKQKVEVDDIKVVSEERSSLPHKKPAAGTLVVCPASVLRQWNRELEEKVTEEAKLSVLIYHGGNRTKDAAELAKYDVVLTTYAIVNNECPKQPSVDEEENEQKNADIYGLSSEFAFGKKPKKAPVNKKGKKRKKGLEDGASDPNCGAIAKVRWFRVILDEAQTIKNHRTQVARACCSLRAKRRWCLSGTPIQNAIEELFSYFRFLKYEPYCKYKDFYKGIKLQISKDSAKGYAKLQLILRSFMLRRTKETVIDGQPIISLPPKDIRLTKVEFSPEERSYYTNLESETRKQFKAYAAAGTVNQNYANILLMLLRLRQACDHPLLVEGVTSKFTGKESLGIPKTLPKEKLGSLLNLLEASSAICCVCNDPPEDACVSVCEHVFCFQCVSDYLTAEDNACPAFRCRTQLNSEVLFSESALRKCLYGDENGDASSSVFYERSSLLKNDYSSSKIKAVVELLHECLTVNTGSEIHSLAFSNGNSSLGNQSLDSRPIKAIVFSQWTGMLNLIEVALKNTGLIYRRLDGGMSLAARDKAVKEFNTIPEVTVMLMSLKAGNLGLNMVAACRVILLDLWWNPTTEDQAIDRAHRIGQTRPVVVSRLTIQNSVEDRILALQEEKRKMVASAFGEDQSGGTATRLTMEDLKYLFGV